MKKKFFRWNVELDEQKKKFDIMGTLNLNKIWDAGLVILQPWPSAGH